MSTKKTIASSTPWKKTIYNQSEFYASWEKSDRFFHAHLVSQTLRGAYSYLLKPDQVFYVGSYPTAYILEVDNVPTEAEEENWRKFLWNQSVVPILIVKVAKKEIRVYTANEYKHSIAETLTFAADALDLLETKIESGAFFGENSEHFDRKEAVDHYLLTNLNDAVEKLCQSGPSDQEFVQLYLARILFICYLIDRGMLKGKYFSSHRRLKKIAPTDFSTPYRLANVLKECTTPNEKRDVIKRIFAETKKRFNGSLFEYGEGSKQSDAPEVSDKFLNALTTFLSGDEIRKGQSVFDFKAYDFNIIPIETISSIYESFLNAQGIQRSSGAYYTPPHLAELVVDIALENVKESKIYEMKVLDPSCGSGVFLVSLFCRMADQLRRHLKYKSVNPSSKWGKMVLELLTRIHGIDSNSTACHIACFSLYLAALEQLKPTDLEDLEDGILPPLLSDPEKGHERGKNIFKANFFDPKLPIEGHKFDLIVGNPPWVSREHQVDVIFETWVEEQVKSTGLEPKNIAPQKQIAYGFLWETSKFLHDNGVACLIVPSSLLWSRDTNNFLTHWLSQATVERVVNFSDLRRILFSGAIHPCCAIRFSNEYDNNKDNIIIYESPKADIRNQIDGPIFIHEDDKVTIFQENAIVSARSGCSVMTWKVPFWGKGRGKQLIDRLDMMPKLRDLTSVPDSKNQTLFIRGQGCQPYSLNDERKERKWYRPWWKEYDSQKPLRFLRTRADFDLLITEKDFSDIPESLNEKLRTSPDRRLFEWPKVIVNKGFTKAAFCHEPVLFQHALQSIASSKNNADILRFLSVVLMSKFIRYYLFHTSENWGSRQTEVHLDELLAMPFFLPEHAPNPQNAHNAFKKIVERFKKFERRASYFGQGVADIDYTLERLKSKFDFENEMQSVREDCEEHITSYYGINDFEMHLVDDTENFIFKSITPENFSIPTLAPIKLENCQMYAGELICMLKAFSWKEKGYPYSAHVYLPGSDDQYGIVRVDRSQEKEKRITVSKEPKELKEAVRRISKHLKQFESERIIHCLNLKVFDGNSLFILKPAQLRFWTRIAAQNDADEIGAEIVKQSGGLK